MTIKNTAISRYVLKLLLLLCVGFIVTVCTHSPQALSLDELHVMYAQAIEDAKVAEPHEISRNLVAIVPSNEELPWDREKKAILVTTWTSWDGYDAHLANAVAGGFGHGGPRREEFLSNAPSHPDGHSFVFFTVTLFRLDNQTLV